MAKSSINNLGEKILEDIEKIGIKHAVVAKRMNVHRQTINQLNRRKTFDLEFLQKIKAATGLDYTNYIFNPKTREYISSVVVEKLEEPKSPIYQNSIEMNLSLILKADKEHLNKLSELIDIFKVEAGKLGFTFK